MRYWLRDHQIEARAALGLLSQLLREWTFAATMRKHGISFDKAGSAFLDQLALSGPDPDHSMGEPRYITFGMSPSTISAQAIHRSPTSSACLSTN